MNTTTALGRLRIIGFAEGLSLLFLLGVAMPLKYLAGKPEAVKIIGWIHGLLFVLFVVALLAVYFQKKWPFKRLVTGVIAAFVPFGTFIFDRMIRGHEIQH